MKNPSSIIAFVPAREGSKSISFKNIKSFNGHPLIYYSLKALQESKVDQIIVSTDGKRTEECVKSLSLSKVSVYHRDPATATDTASTESAIMDYLIHNPEKEDALFVLAQATSPWTTSQDINNAIELLSRTDADSLLSVVEDHGFIWSQEGQSLNYDHNNRPRRQDMPHQFRENGAFYINSVRNILKFENRLSGKIAYHVMPKWTSLEIDDEEDWAMAEILMKSLAR